MNLLTNKEIQKKLSELDVEWAVIDGVHLERVYEFKDFAEALSFVNKVGEIAEEQNHHPDIHLVEYKKVIVKTTTHDCNGLTEKDFKIARAL